MDKEQIKIELEKKIGRTVNVLDAPQLLVSLLQEIEDLKTRVTILEKK